MPSLNHEALPTGDASLCVHHVKGSEKSYSKEPTVSSRVKLLWPKIDFKKNKAERMRRDGLQLAPQNSLMLELARVTFPKVLFAC